MRVGRLHDVGRLRHTCARDAAANRGGAANSRANRDAAAAFGNAGAECYTCADGYAGSVGHTRADINTRAHPDPDDTAR
jgi:hypothetical protein